MRRRLFRRRTNWDVLKGNLYVVVTAAALIAAAYAWNAGSIADRAPPGEMASAVTREIIDPSELEATLDQEPPPNVAAPPPALALLTPATLRIVEPREPSAALQPAAKPPTPRRRAGAPPALSAGTPATAASTAIAPAPRSVEHAPRTPRVRAIVHQQPRHLRNASPSETPRRAKIRQRGAKHGSAHSDGDPFSCTVRKQSPCF